MEARTVAVPSTGGPWLPGLMNPLASEPAELTALVAPAPVLGFEPDMGALLKFRTQMAQHGEPVQVARMCFDRRYAFERIAQAHACGSDRLRRLALELFQAYLRREELGPQVN
jgi:hypothetical protein